MTAADPGMLRRAAAAGQAVQQLRATAGAIGHHRDVVRARCGQRAVVAAGLEELRHAAAHADETDQLVTAVAVAVTAADTAPWPGSRPAGDALAADGRGNVPWLDPDTDSWVVGLGRALSGGPPSPALVGRLLDDGPALLDGVIDPELSLLQQATTLLTDPGRFVADWRRAGVGALDATRALAVALAGTASIITPGADGAAQRLLGRRYGTETRRAIIGGARRVVSDPDAVVEAALGVETYRQDPYRWLGSMLPDVLLEAATTALPVSILRPARLLDPPSGLVVSGGPGRPPTPAARPAGSSPPPPDLDAVRRLEPEWGPAPEVATHRQAPFEPPETWVADLNGDGHTSPGRDTNCVDCARAAEVNWRGHDAVAAPVADTHRTGVTIERIEDWAGAPMVPATLDEIAEELSSLGPGSSAIVASSWGGGGAHAYNAVNDAGVVRWVDAQLGRTATWPPPYADDVEVSLVLYLDPEGRPR